jgi:hypothetical protein
MISRMGKFSIVSHFSVAVRRLAVPWLSGNVSIFHSDGRLDSTSMIKLPVLPDLPVHN